jgi:ABC-type spermidine/putrescine transport system permease subunit II
MCTGAGEFFMLALIVSAVIGIIAIFASLFVKFELERAIGKRKKIFLLHFANICITNVVIASSYYIFSGMFETNSQSFYIVYLASLECLLPVYVVCYLLYEQYERTKKKYTISEDKKVLYIKPKYLAMKHYKKTS